MLNEREVYLLVIFFQFGVADGEGSVCLWQVGLGVNMSKPYLSLKCHNKMTCDFVFVGSSSLLATAGQSSESRNVCLWDTLLPQRTSLIQGERTVSNLYLMIVMQNRLTLLDSK